MKTLTEIDFKLLFESVPGLYLILSPDLVIFPAQWDPKLGIHVT